MLTKQIEGNLIHEFQKKERFTRQELYEFYKNYEPELKEGTFGWRIHELKQKHIIKDVKKGVYTLEQKQPYQPTLDPTLLNIAKSLQGSFDHHYYNIWNTAWLNEFTELQAASFLTVLEVDKDSVQGVFFSLKDAGFSSLFLKPDQNVINTYIAELKEAIVVKPMITRAPVMKVKNVIVPTLEKILVDIFCEPDLFFAFQGHQLVLIFGKCLEKYHINFSRMFNYAKRRKRDEALKEFLSTNLPETIKEIME